MALVLMSCARESAPEPAPSAAERALGQPAMPTAGEVPASATNAADRAYPLDHISRAVGSGAVRCPEVEVREFSGADVRFAPPARVIDPFREQLRQLEGLVKHVSERFYGRWPSEVSVAASHDCRAVSGRRRLSEHALGNAIDITAFRFAAAPVVAADGSVRPSAVPGAFEVRVDAHWRAKGDAVVQRHAAFLEALTRELVARGVFRTLLGPADPDHQDHFHFDMAPGKHVEL